MTSSPIHSIAHKQQYVGLGGPRFTKVRGHHTPSRVGNCSSKSVVQQSFGASAESQRIQLPHPLLARLVNLHHTDDGSLSPKSDA